MTPDTLVFDIETQNFFTDPGVGWNNYAALKISTMCVYSYSRDVYLCAEENELFSLAQVFRDASRIVGFGINRFDVPVLTHYFRNARDPSGLDLWNKERIDLLTEIEQATGKRISLSRLAEANLGISKELHGHDAIALYREGRIEELRNYCKNDVSLTKALYEIYTREGHFFIPDKATGKMEKVVLRSIR